MLACSSGEAAPLECNRCCAAPSDAPLILQHNHSPMTSRRRTSAIAQCAVAAISMIAFFAAPQRLNAQRVAFNTTGPLYHHAANESRGYEDLMIPGIVIANDRTSALVLDSLRIEVVAGTRVLATITVDPHDVRASTEELAQMREMGLTSVVDLAVAPGVLGSAREFAVSDTLGSGTAVIGPPSYLAVSGAPTFVRARVDLHSADGKPVSVWTAELRVVAPPEHEFAFPLHGVWFARSIPGITSHHRWNQQTEFAIDFWKVDSTGSPFRGTGRRAADYYGFGLPIYAADGGEVVAVENAVTQDWVARLQRAGETDDAYVRRVSQYNMQSMKGDVHKALMGNYVVIAHANGLYTAYGHLKVGSVIVAKGQHVTRGQAIGRVGDTGDSQMVHLHFQVCDGPDPLAAHTIPISFADVSIDQLDLGSFAIPAARDSSSSRKP